jgi:hypothetical protein
MGRFLGRHSQKSAQYAPFREPERKALPPAGDTIFISRSRLTMLMKMC